jgi:DNA-binding YbaB/EbfC family protein
MVATCVQPAFGYLLTTRRRVRPFRRVCCRVPDVWRGAGARLKVWSPYVGNTWCRQYTTWQEPRRLVTTDVTDEEHTTVNPGDVNLQQLLEQAQLMQQQLVSAQQELNDAEVEGSAGGGLVVATVNGGGELLELKISGEAVEPGDPQETADTIADLVIAAIRDAVRAAADLQQEKLGPLAQGLGGGSGLGQLPGF